ncbi:hypothetical protein GOBAR_DD31681 [Gossypium barbadense]|nr:hypothetical protein GOBAR_DD31681 [Gossypium barbadense]
MAAGAPSFLYFINGKTALITLKLPINFTSIINFISSSPCFSNACGTNTPWLTTSTSMGPDSTTAPSTASYSRTSAAKIATSTPWAPPVYGGSETGERHELLLTRLFEPRPSRCHSNRWL